MIGMILWSKGERVLIMFGEAKQPFSSSRMQFSDVYEFKTRGVKTKFTKNEPHKIIAVC